MDMRKNNLGYVETAKKYELVSYSVGAAILTLHRWERIFLEEGEAGFYIERRGWTRKTYNPKKGRPKKNLDKQVEQDLISENQQLKERLEQLEMKDE